MNKVTLNRTLRDVSVSNMCTGCTGQSVRLLNVTKKKTQRNTTLPLGIDKGSGHIGSLTQTSSSVSGDVEGHEVRKSNFWGTMERTVRPGVDAPETEV